MSQKTLSGLKAAFPMALAIEIENDRLSEKGAESRVSTNETFQKIVILGYGKVTGEVLQYVYDRKKEYGYEMEFIEHEIHSFSITEKICAERGIPFHRITDKKELAEALYRITDKTLIVSASNNFLFPASLVEKPHITIVNFHNALLPAYPGRNAPTWVIYQGEKRTGITWHYVTAGVDEGSIIIQKDCEITEDMKAYELTERLMDLASAAFRECFADIMAECAQTTEQGFDPGRRMYRSCEMPADGILDLSEEPETIYRLLRSVDYGKHDIFPRLQTRIDGRKAQILRYRRISADKRREGDGLMYLPLGDGGLLKIKYGFTDNESM